MAKRPPIKWDFRDVSSGLQMLRQFLLGRKYTPHNRYPPLIAPRSIPPPDVPRGPEETNRYSDFYYSDRNALGSVKPPVVAPIAEGARTSISRGGSAKIKCSQTKMDTKKLVFKCPPTPGCTWWWDAHCYYQEVGPAPQPCAPFPSIPPPPPPPCGSPPRPPPKQKPKVDPCAQTPDCRLDPCEREPPPPPPPPPPCDPCDPKYKK
ncbi:hypothetical protein SFRURICE_014614 [Spodoptera frugiperda]|uniref:SFRICE_009773 n=1 Tax=Spodoptera frugiperda TaxID=7108 RepID=A0A2H1WEY4_SPOFR|nr:hypothetical protein SFRURICE_014614 [Spodoptera frugiperda]